MAHLSEDEPEAQRGHVIRPSSRQDDAGLLDSRVGAGLLARTVPLQVLEALLSYLLPDTRAPAPESRPPGQLQPCLCLLLSPTHSAWQAGAVPEGSASAPQWPGVGS